jgi:hypothetical protein
MRRIGFVLIVGLVVSWLAAASCLPTPHASADTLQLRSLMVQNPTSGATTAHTFQFTYQTAATIGSVVFEYCDSPLPELPCNAPVGLDASGAVLQSQSGATGFTVVSATTNQITIGRVPASIAGHFAASYGFSGVTNPTGPPQAFYVRIRTYTSSDASNPQVDNGSVVNSTAQSVQVSTEVPPILSFCVGQSIPTDCSSASGDVVDLGVLRSTSVATGTSQLQAATNADFGLTITTNGTTMTSGNNVVTPLDTPTASATGKAQFGMNLRANTAPPIGQNPNGPGIANPTGQYNIVNRFVFHPGDVIATSPDTTDVRKFTVSYITNVPPGQAPGVYTATLTYICAASF